MDIVENAGVTPEEADTTPANVESLEETSVAAVEAVEVVEGAAVAEVEAGEVEAVEAVEDAAVEAAEVAPEAVAAWTTLKTKDEVRGKVKSIALFGAFITLENGVDGLLHISQFSADGEHPVTVKNVSDMMNVGDDVTVWVRKVDAENKRIDLTMIQPLGLSWGEIKEGMTVTGKVSRIERFGVFVEIGAERPGMIHVSELSGDYVSAPEDIVKVGDEIQARVIKVNRKRKQIDLSKKALEEPLYDMSADDADEAPAMSAMELALRTAMRGTEMGDEYSADKETKKVAKKDAALEKRRREQEALLERTLRNRVK